MFTLPPALRIYVATTPTDMRKSFDGLSAAVTQIIGQDPTSGLLARVRDENTALAARLQLRPLAGPTPAAPSQGRGAGSAGAEPPTALGYRM